MRSWGTFLYGDQGNDLIATMKDSDGNIRDVTADTSIVLAWRSENGVTGTQTGTIVAPGINGQYRFAAPGTWIDPGVGNSLYLDFAIQWVVSAETFKTREIGRITIVRFP
jgi:hypothetical protein